MNLNHAEQRLCRKVVAEMIFYMSLWIIILLALYFFGMTDVWELLLVSAGYWGILGAWSLYKLSPERNGNNGREV